MPAPRLWSSPLRPRPARFPPRVRPGAPRAAPAALVGPVGPVRPVAVRVVRARPAVQRVAQAVPVRARPAVVRAVRVRPAVVRAVPVRPAVVRVEPAPAGPAVSVHLWQAARPLRVEHLSVHRWRMPRALRVEPRPQSWIPRAHRSPVRSVMVHHSPTPLHMSARVVCRAPVVAKAVVAAVRRVAE
ncbi:hypothetical protein C6A86_019415 [Mycobacterium sp. ITM-2016-00316]|uniref:hypothetical protein n=1 Tax=Mycobacterium sp. ITM-2016-00316 TaxID=2099695 RepID=UPI00287F6BE9|nr:hypothetical protein [Mycobacterium sp. ITM-2016-00316]WNG80389.1 hypothetical protein C6A86_019415 [Mycobacterium sp. ITM-2016-00316]